MTGVVQQLQAIPAAPGLQHAESSVVLPDAPERVLDQPQSYGAVVGTVRRLAVQPSEERPYMVNVDGGRMLTRGEVRISVSGQVWLISGKKA